MTLPKAVNIFFAGGIGDVAMKLASRHDEGAFVTSLKQTFPQVKIRAVIVSVSYSSKELFTYNPNFDEVIFQIWSDPHKRFMEELGKGYPYLDDLKDLQRELCIQQQPFYLSPEEHKRVQSLQSEPYALVHLFAGDPKRDWLQRYDQYQAEKLFDLITSKGLKVILLGGSSVKQEDQVTYNLEENREWEYPNVTNLIGKESVRVQCHLVQKATACVGTMSAYCSLATRYYTPIFVTTPSWQRKFFEDPHSGVFHEMVVQNASINYFDEPYYTPQYELSRLEEFLNTLHQRGRHARENFSEIRPWFGRSSALRTISPPVD